MSALDIVATGIVCPVGLSSGAAYTAICANVSAYADTSFLLSGDRFEAAIGAVVPLRPPPRLGQELPRLERLAELALEECLMGAGVAARDVVLLLGVAEPHRFPPARERAAGDLLARLRRTLGFHAESRVLPLGNAAAFEGLARARELLTAGHVSCCIVGGVDSMLNEHDLTRLQESYRIRTDNDGQGLVPGEAAAFVAVTRPGHPSLATVTGVGFGREAEATSVISTGHPSGRGLVQAWNAAVEDAGAHERDVMFRMSDMTGERYAGMDAAIAVSRYFRSDRQGLPVWHPAENVGATGAAAGGLGLAIAALALNRRFPELQGAVLCEASSEAGLRGACLLRAPQRPAAPAAAPKRPRLRVVVDEHAEEAAFLFGLREQALDAPHYDLRTLTLLDARIRAHLDGLVEAGPSAFRQCARAMAPDRPGELTVAAILAYSTGEPKWIDTVLDCVAEDWLAARSIVAALGYLPWQLAGPHVRVLLGSPHPVRARIGVRAAAVHRSPLLLQQPLAPPARAAATLAAYARALGELGARDHVDELLRHASSGPPELQFWAAWAATRLGARPVAPLLLAAAERDGPWAQQALDLATLALPPDEARRWLDRWIRQGAPPKRALQLAGRLGDVSLVPWLLEQMTDPQRAAAAGESFTLITGIDLVAAQLDGPPPEEPGPNDDPDDENVALEADDELPSPDAARVSAHWKAVQHSFSAAQRYLCGRDRSEASLLETLRHASQRQRNLAALALAIARPGDGLFETRAPAEQQAHALGVPRYWTI